MTKKYIRSDFLASEGFKTNFVINKKQNGYFEATFMSSILKIVGIYGSFVKITCSEIKQDKWLMITKPTSLFYISLAFPIFGSLQIPLHIYAGRMNAMELLVALIVLSFFCLMYFLIYLFHKKKALKLLVYQTQECEKTTHNKIND